MAVDTPYAFVRGQMASGSHRPSVVASLVHQNALNNSGELTPDDDADIKWLAAMMYAGGVETTSSTLGFFVMVMAKFPEAQHKAQEEIDQVIGSDRLPGLADRKNLPHVDDVVKEAYRWFPPGPMGLPHVTVEGDVYNGYTIPKGSILLPAVWWFFNDPEVYKNPEAFDPERYSRNEPDPGTVAFGYGRRVCPGWHLADATVFLSITQLLAVFNITKKVDEHGRDMESKMEANPGLTARTVNSVYNIVPR